MKPIQQAAALAAAVSASPAFACASCGCTLTADWLAQGLVAQPGTTLGLRYDYIPQTVLRSGSGRVGHIDFPFDREIEKHTYNHYLTASLDHQFASDWGVDLQLPYLRRPHATIDEGETGVSTSDTGGIGDLRVTGRWQGLSTPGAITGLQLGLVLPTGRSHQTFRTGPEAGEEVDRGLQPGTGTVQLVAGAYRYGKLATMLDYILQAQGQVPLDRGDGYRPGAIVDVSGGLHYTRWRGITPQVQLAFRATQRDAGPNSDRFNSGGQQLNLSPGLIAGLGGGLSAFAYATVPLWEHVNGYQLVPRASLSLGLQYRL